ncbi:MAG: hypothetical protein R3C49_18080 [Planctomycetaceae bacterium]
MAFRHLQDRLFLLSLLLWVGGRLLKEFCVSPPFVRCYLNDLICIPFWLPIMTFVLSRIGLRLADRCPAPMEIALTLVTFAIVFEFLMPAMDAFRGQAIHDPNDILCYAVGAFVADEYWRRTYRQMPDSG